MANISGGLAGLEMIYFDYNATAPYSPSVREYLQTGFLEDWQNPSSVYPQAQILDQRIRECRKAIAERLNCPPKHLFFTSGGTESINTVLSFETLRLNQSPAVISSPLEHHAVLKRIECLAKYSEDLRRREGKNPHAGGAPVNKSSNQTKARAFPALQNESPINKSQKILPLWIQSNKHGEIRLSQLEELCLKYPRSLLSFLSANNETGVISDIKKISAIAKKHNCLIHVDAVQSFGKTPINLEDWDVDFASFSGHKIGAMKGIGLFYAKKPFAPLMHGGGQERGMRPGTYNFPAIYSLKLAVQDIDFQKWEKVKQLRDYFEKSLLGEEFEENRAISAFSYKKPNISPFKINCRKASRLPNTTSLYCGPGASHQAVLLSLAKKGICASTGSACNAGSPEPSHVLTALADLEELGDPRAYAGSCIRISFSPHNTKQETTALIQSLKSSAIDRQAIGETIIQTAKN